jgi:hypothetical protein
MHMHISNKINIDIGIDIDIDCYSLLATTSTTTLTYMIHAVRHGPNTDNDINAVFLLFYFIICTPTHIDILILFSMFLSNYNYIFFVRSESEYYMNIRIHMPHSDSFLFS